MKVIEHFDVPAPQLADWLKDHYTQDFKVEYILEKNSYHITIAQDCTEADFHMLTLNTMCNTLKNTLTTEEKNAIDYAISSIKTLQDMGVIK